MKDLILTIPTFAFVVSTRAALAAGIGLLLSGKLSDMRRRALGTTLVAIGAVATIPAAVSVVRGVRARSRINRDRQLVGAMRFARKGDDEF